MHTFRIRSFQAGQVPQWFACGWRLWRRRPLEATAPAAAFVLVALLLRVIPVIGNVLLLLVLPTVVASYFVHVHVLAHTASAPRPGSAKRTFAPEPALRELRKGLFGAMTNSQNVFPLILIGLVMVVLGLVAYGLFTAVAGQAAVSPYGFFELTPDQMVRLLLGYGTAGLFWLVIAALLLWAMPLFAIRDVPLVSALGLNLRALGRNAAAALVFLLVLVLVLLPAAMLQPWSPLASAVVLWLSATAAAAALGFGGYCSFRLVFADADAAAHAPAATARPVSPRS